MPNPIAVPRTTISWKVPTELLEQIDEVAPPGTRATWIEEACRQKLAGAWGHRSQLARLEAKLDRERVKDIRENGPGAAMPCTHPTYELKPSMGRKVCTSCGALKP